MGMAAALLPGRERPLTRRRPAEEEGKSQETNMVIVPEVIWTCAIGCRRVLLGSKSRQWVAGAVRLRDWGPIGLGASKRRKRCRLFEACALLAPVSGCSRIRLPAVGLFEATRATCGAESREVIYGHALPQTTRKGMAPGFP